MCSGETASGKGEYSEETTLLDNPILNSYLPVELSFPEKSQKMKIVGQIYQPPKNKPHSPVDLFINMEIILVRILSTTPFALPSGSWKEISWRPP